MTNPSPFIPTRRAAARFTRPPDAMRSLRERP
jgi:hypothetical protein